MLCKYRFKLLPLHVVDRFMYFNYNLILRYCFTQFYNIVIVLFQIHKTPVFKVYILHTSLYKYQISDYS